jgi:hypothetical protein
METERERKESAAQIGGRFSWRFCCEFGWKLSEGERKVREEEETR